jgi:antitoxin component of RelBE/YafQ-DinJ toxin-antitoxin module
MPKRVAEKRKTYPFTLDSAVKEAAQAEAKRCGLSLSHVVEEMLKLFIAIQGDE